MISIKKLNLFLTCFIFLFLIIGAYLEVYIKSQSVYWLAGKYMGFIIVGSCQLFIDIRKNESSKGFIFFNILIWIVVLGLWGYGDLSKYKRNICHDKFGLEFNARRRTLGVPEIPGDWHIDHRTTLSFRWEWNQGTVGHESKLIFVDSLCSIGFELDNYILKPINGVSRAMSITTLYSKEKGTDTISYQYDGGHTSRSVSRQQADSIFAAEKINKDY